MNVTDASYAQVGSRKAAVLLVDDDEGTLETWRYCLTHDGFTVSACRSAAEAMRVLLESSFDVIVVDVFLGDGSGLEVIARVRQHDDRPRIVVVPGFSTIDTFREALKLGVTDYLEKPIVSAVLVDAVERAWRARQDVLVGAPVDHAAEKWVAAVMRAMVADHDPRTLTQWGRVVAASSGSLRNLCYLVNVGPRQSLMLARLLRAMWRAREMGWEPKYLLDVSDRRTLMRFSKQLGASRPSGASRSEQAAEFLRHQTLVTNKRVLRQLEIALLRADEQ